MGEVPDGGLCLQIPDQRRQNITAFFREGARDNGKHFFKWPMGSGF